MNVPSDWLAGVGTGLGVGADTRRLVYKFGVS
jgi:hypothetical protein